MKHLTIILALLFSYNLRSQHKNIQFETGSWASVMEKAKKENKLIFVDAYTTWCGPCKMMARSVFTNDSVADHFNSNFVNYKMDMEKGEGLTFAKTYEVNCYPNLLFIDGKGTLVHRSAGYLEPAKFLSFARTAKTPAKTFVSQKAEYEKNGLTEANIMSYIELMQSACFDPSSQVTAYLKNVKEEELLQKNNWELMSAYINDYRSREMTYFLKNIAAFEKSYGTKAIHSKVLDLGRNYFEPFTRAKTHDQAAFGKAKQDFKALNWPQADKIMFNASLRINERFDKPAFYALAAAEYLKYNNDNAGALNSMAWKFYEEVDNKEHLQAAVLMAKQCCALEPEYAYLDTYASVLFKAGNYTEADQIAAKAIEEAKKAKMQDEEYKETTELQKKIKAKLNSK
jgi:thioredoxin-related protein